MTLIYQGYRQWDFKKTTITNTRPINSVKISKIQHHPQYRKFLRVIDFVHRMGIVEGKQLYVLFGLTKAERDYLTKQSILVVQQLVCKEYELKVYTLHRNAMYIAPNLPKRVDNYWLSYEVENVLQILTAIEYYILFAKGKKNVFIQGNVPPFPCKINFNGNSFNIYVLRGLNLQFEEYLRIASVKSPNVVKRLVVICENINHMTPLIEAIEKSNIRVRIVDESSILKDGNIENAFFYIKEGQFVREQLQMQ